jgi:hypothetical protein
LDRNRLLAILAFFVLLLPSVCVFYQARDIPQFGVIEDDGLYFTAAKSLAEQGEYRMLSIPGQPYQTKYPPLYPLLLSLVWRANPVFPGNLVLASLVSWLCWLLFLGSAFVFLGQCGLTTTGRWTAWVLLAASSRLILISSDLLSEALFSALILNALLLAECSTKFRKPALAAAFAGLLCAAACLTKTSAIPLLATTPLVFLLRKQYVRALCFFCAAAPFVAGWMIWSGAHRTGLLDPIELYYRDYIGFYRLSMTWKEVPSLFVSQLAQMLSAVGSGILFQPQRIFLVIVSGLAIVGAIRLLGAGRLPHVAAFAAAFSAELLFWDYPVNERYLFPLMPLLGAGLVHESQHILNILQRAARHPHRRVAQRAALGFAMAALLAISITNGRAIFWRIPCELTRYRTALCERRAAYLWIDRHLPSSSGFVAYNDVNLYLYSGRPAYRNEPLMRPYLTGDKPGIERTVTGLADFARQHQLRYIFCSDTDYELNGPVLNDTARRDKLFEKNHGLRQIYTSSRVRIYQVDTPPVLLKAQ